MKKYSLLAICVMMFHISISFGQTHVMYEISFENAVHHLAEVSVTFSGLDLKPLKVRMSRTSPGRYALHEFAKNVYDVRAMDGKGIVLEITRPDPYQWLISGHDGTVRVNYKLYANRGDGTYSQIDETHAHLNIPATFMYSPDYSQRPVKLQIHTRADLNWKIATQLNELEDGSYFAPDLYYFMDSPLEISNFSLRQFPVESNGHFQNIRMILHHDGTEEEMDQYFEMVKKIVSEQKQVYGEYPEFDFGEYTFLACYLPNVFGDGMEHRNSTVITSTRSLSGGGMEWNIGTVSHEFFHAWNVERIRPLSLEPFDFEEANMSGELWFAEGFTSYYTDLILCRAGIITEEEYIESLAGDLNIVINGPGRRYNNPIEMSYQAPFVDAATAVDPVNRENTFISYYSYGSVLGLALDLSLRSLDNDLDLDGLMKEIWKIYGKSEVPYTVKDLEIQLSKYSGKKFSEDFFRQHIYGSEVPDFKKLFRAFGVIIEKSNPEEVWFGSNLQLTNGKLRITSNPFEGSSAYNAGLSIGDDIVSLDEYPVTSETDARELLSGFKAGQKVPVVFERYGQQMTSEIKFLPNPNMETKLFEQMEKSVPEKVKQRRNAWLHSKTPD